MEYTNSLENNNNNNISSAIHLIIPTESGLVHAGQKHSTIKIAIIITLVLVTIIVILFVIYFNYNWLKGRKSLRSLLPYHHNIVIPFMFTTNAKGNAPPDATLKEKEEYEQEIIRRMSSVLSLPPKIQRIESFRPISLPFSFSRSSFRQDIIKDPVFRAIITDMSTFCYTFSSTSKKYPSIFNNATTSSLSLSGSMNSKATNDAMSTVISCVTNNTVVTSSSDHNNNIVEEIERPLSAIIIKQKHQQQQPFYLFGSNSSLDTSSMSLASQSNKSVQSLQWIGFTENMDSNYAKNQRLEVVNSFHCYRGFIPPIEVSCT